MYELLITYVPLLAAAVIVTAPWWIALLILRGHWDEKDFKDPIKHYPRDDEEDYNI